MLRKELEGSNPELYRQLALYLQVLREILPRSVDQACFHLATQIHPGHYASLPKLQRQRFHARLAELVDRCTSLLTVEQLISLAARLAKQHARQRRQLRRDEPMLDTAESSAPDGLQRDDAPASHNTRQSTSMGNTHPQGSIELGLGLPIEAGWLGWGGAQSGSSGEWPHEHPPLADDDGDAPAGEEVEEQDPSVDGISHHEALAEALGDFLRDALTQDFNAAAGDEMDTSEDSDEPLGWEAESSAAQPGNEPRDLTNLFSAFAEAAGMGELFRGLQESSDHPAGGGRGSSESSDHHPSDAEPDSEQGHDSDHPSSAPLGPQGRRALRIRSLPIAVAAIESDRPLRRAVLDPAALFLPPPGGGLLPRDPIALLAWLDGFEHALACRLRNLSHALNGLLLQAGLSRVLLPMGLLEAVLAGQIEGQSPQPNLLQLPLPLGFGQGETSWTIHAILLRSADLELEQPRLRTVRGRLQQRRRETRRMAQHYHRLLRRLQAQEAEALWQEDIREMRHDRQAPHLPQ